METDQKSGGGLPGGVDLVWGQFGTRNTEEEVLVITPSEGQASIPKKNVNVPCTEGTTNPLDVI